MIGTVERELTSVSFFVAKNQRTNHMAKEKTFYWKAVYKTKDGDERIIKVTAADEDYARSKAYFISGLFDTFVSITKDKEVEENKWRA